MYLSPLKIRNAPENRQVCDTVDLIGCEPRAIKIDEDKGIL